MIIPMARSTCSADGCTNLAVAKTLCLSHYQKARAADPATPRCSEAGCSRGVKAKHLCAYHYQKRKLEDTTGPRCQVEGCERPRVANDLCMAHDKRRRAGRPLGAPIRAYERSAVRRVLASADRTEAGCLAYRTGALQAHATDDSGRIRLAHRIIYEAAHGPLSRRLHVHHGCVNPICVELAHLMPATPKLHKYLHRLIRDEALSIADQQATVAAYFSRYPQHLTHPELFSAEDHALAVTDFVHHFCQRLSKPLENTGRPSRPYQRRYFRRVGAMRRITLRMTG